MQLPPAGATRSGPMSHIARSCDRQIVQTGGARQAGASCSCDAPQVSLHAGTFMEWHAQHSHATIALSRMHFPAQTIEKARRLQCEMSGICNCPQLANFMTSNTYTSISQSKPRICLFSFCGLQGNCPPSARWQRNQTNVVCARTPAQKHNCH